MAVITRSFLVPIESDCGRAILTGVSSLGHRGLRRVLNAQYFAETQIYPELCQLRRVGACIWRIRENDVVIERSKRLSERESRASMYRRQITGAERIDVLLENSQAFRILLHEVGAGCSARKCFQSERARTGIEIAYTRVRKIELENAHPGLTNSIESRSDVRAGRRAYSAAAPAARDYAQVAGSGKLDAGSGTRVLLFTRHSLGCQRFSLGGNSLPDNHRARV